MSSSIDSKILPAANTKRDKSFSLQKSLYATEKVIRNESLSMALNNKGTLPNPTPSES